MADTTISGLNTLAATGNSVLPISFQGTTYQTPASSVIDTIGLRTDGIKIPTGTSAQRAVTPADGSIRYNTTLNTPEIYYGGQWRVVVTYNTNTYEVLVVAGGGGGGNGSTNPGYGRGGGGAGGVVYNSALTLTTNTLYTVSVGEGGIGNQSGGNSIISLQSTAVVIASGGGCGNDTENGLPGGSGGGAGGNGSIRLPGQGLPGQGFRGGFMTQNNGGGTGGGGAGGVGFDQQTNVDTYAGGRGGPGVQFNITGVNTFYAAGGGGGSRYNGSNCYEGGSGIGGNGAIYSPFTAPTNGVDGTGSGGGGAGWLNYNTFGGKGGSGVIIIAYPGAPRANLTGFVTTDTTTRPGYTVHKFTGNGTINFTS